MKALLVMLAVAVSLSGCVTRSQKVVDYQKASRRDSDAIFSAGVPADGYWNSPYAKTHDTAGYIASVRARQAKEHGEERAQFDRDAPMLLQQTKACISGNYVLSEAELAVVAKRCFPQGYNYGRVPPRWRDEVAASAASELAPHYAEVRAQMKNEARQQAADDRAQAVQDKRDREAAAKRAYDNSLKSLVE